MVPWLTLNWHINHIRIYNSLLEFNNNSYILNIALRNGFNSLEYFSETFKNIIGVSPSVYKKFISISSYISEEDDIKIRDSINKLQTIKYDTIKKNMSVYYLMKMSWKKFIIVFVMVY